MKKFLKSFVTISLSLVLAVSLCSASVDYAGDYSVSAINDTHKENHSNR